MPRLRWTLLPLLLSACHSVPQLEISRIARAPSGPREVPTFIDLHTLRIGDQQKGFPFMPYERVKTRNPMRFDVAQAADEPPGAEFAAVVAPWPNHEQAAIVEVRSSQPSVFVGSGFVFAWGRFPIIVTQHVRAAAEGTVIAVEIVDANLTRAYFIAADTPQDHVVVSCIANPNMQVTLTKPGTFVEIATPCGFGDILNIDAHQSANAFAQFATDSAMAAGYVPPSGESDGNAPAGGGDETIDARARRGAADRSRKR